MNDLDPGDLFDETLAACNPEEQDCPRCNARVTQRFYGICSNCATELQGDPTTDPAKQDNEQVDTRFVPSANVTPNFVATKD